MEHMTLTDLISFQPLGTFQGFSTAQKYDMYTTG